MLRSKFLSKNLSKHSLLAFRLAKPTFPLQKFSDKHNDQDSYSGKVNSSEISSIKPFLEDLSKAVPKQIVKTSVLAVPAYLTSFGAFYLFPHPPTVIAFLGIQLVAPFTTLYCIKRIKGDSTSSKNYYRGALLSSSMFFGPSIFSIYYSSLFYGGGNLYLRLGGDGNLTRRGFISAGVAAQVAVTLLAAAAISPLCLGALPAVPFFSMMFAWNLNGAIKDYKSGLNTNVNFQSLRFHRAYARYYGGFFVLFTVIFLLAANQMGWGKFSAEFAEFIREGREKLSEWRK